MTALPPEPSILTKSVSTFRERSTMATVARTPTSSPAWEPAPSPSSDSPPRRTSSRSPSFTEPSSTVRLVYSCTLVPTLPQTGLKGSSDLFFRYGNDNVYVSSPSALDGLPATAADEAQIFTNKKDASVTVHRYIVRMPGGTFSYNTDGSSSGDSDFYPDGSTTLEATGDVVAMSDGTTWSKHYNGGLYGRVKDCT